MVYTAKIQKNCTLSPAAIDPAMNARSRKLLMRNTKKEAALVERLQRAEQVVFMS